MKILGVDPSTKTGWAVLSSQDGVVSDCDMGTITFGDLRGMQRLQKIGRSFDKLLDVIEPDVVCIEEYGYANKHNLATLVEIGAVMRWLVLRRDILIIQVPPKTLKMAITGNGNADKKAMMSEVKKVWGVLGTDDEIDAYCLARFIIELRFPNSYDLGGRRGLAYSKWKDGKSRVIRKLQLIAHSN